MNFHPYLESSSSSLSPQNQSKLKRLTRTHLFHSLPTSNSKAQQLAKVRTKLPNLSALTLDIDTTRLVSRRSTARKVLKYTSKINIDNSCKKLPSQMRNTIPNCKHYFLQSNINLSLKGVIYLAKAVHRTSPKYLESMQISTMSPCNDKVNIKALFNLIATKRQLRSIKLTVNPSLNERNLTALRRAFSSLHKLQTLSLTTSNLSKDTISHNIPNPLGVILSNLRNLKNFYFKCFVTRVACDELNNIIDKLTLTNRLEKIELFLHTSDRLPITFYSLLSEKLSMIRGLNTLGLTIDSFTNQRLNNTFFVSLSKIKSLEKLTISANQLSISDKEMQSLFKTLTSLSLLKEFKFKAGGKAVNFSNDYYISFHEALSQMAHLEDLTYEIKNLGSNYFPHLFDRLPMFPRLRTLSLNVTIGEGELGNVYFLSEFLKRTQNLKSLSLKINDGNCDMYVYQVPSEVFNILHEGLKAIPSLERFELSLGSIEDGGLNRIMLTLNELRKLQCLKLDGFFHEITYQAFEGLCNSLRRQKDKLREVRIVPKQYPYPNMDLLHKVVNEIHSARC